MAVTIPRKTQFRAVCQGWASSLETLLGIRKVTMYGKLPLGKLFEQHCDDEKNVLISPLKFQGTSADHTSVNQPISNNAVKPRMEASIKHTHFSIFTDSMHRNTISFIFQRSLAKLFFFYLPNISIKPSHSNLSTVCHTAFIHMFKNFSCTQWPKFSNSQWL